MYTLKSIQVDTKADAPIPGERLLLWVDAVFTDGTTDVAIDFKIENKELMDNTLRSIIARLNQRDAEKAIINTTNYVIPEVSTVIPEPTPEEIKMNQIAAKEMELQIEIEKTEKNIKLAELAKTNPEIAIKASELEVLKTEEIAAEEIKV